MTNYEKLSKDLKKKVEYVKNENIVDSDTSNMVEKVESELRDAETNIDPMVKKIREKVKTYACDFQLAVNKEQEKEEKGQELIMDLKNNEDILKKRREDLENIHQASQQIKEISDKMAQDVNEQGALLNNIENNVVEAEENAHKAKKEVIEANKISKSNKKKCVIFYVVLSVVGLAGIGCLIFAGIKYFNK